MKYYTFVYYRKCEMSQKSSFFLFIIYVRSARAIIYWYVFYDIKRNKIIKTRPKRVFHTNYSCLNEKRAYPYLLHHEPERRRGHDDKNTFSFPSRIYDVFLFLFLFFSKTYSIAYLSVPDDILWLHNTNYTASTKYMYTPKI